MKISGVLSIILVVLTMTPVFAQSRKRIRVSNADRRSLERLSKALPGKGEEIELLLKRGKNGEMVTELLTAANKAHELMCEKSASTGRRRTAAKAVEASWRLLLQEYRTSKEEGIRTQILTAWDSGLGRGSSLALQLRVLGPPVRPFITAKFWKEFLVSSDRLTLRSVCAFMRDCGTLKDLPYLERKSRSCKDADCRFLLEYTSEWIRYRSGHKANDPGPAIVAATWPTIDEIVKSTQYRREKQQAGL